MQYEWVLFDADDTLFQFDAFKGLKLMFSRYGVDFTEHDFAIYEQVNKPLWVDYQDGKITATQLQHRRFEEWAQRLAVTPAELNSAFLSAMADICALLPGASELLDSLKGKAKLGIITNGFTELQTVRLQRTGVHDYFAALVISEQVGVAKPDKAIFEHALQMMDYPDRNRVLMVGDNPHSDILGGINAGMDTCWINAHSKVRPAGIEPMYEVRSLHELNALLNDQ